MTLHCRFCRKSHHIYNSNELTEILSQHKNFQSYKISITYNIFMKVFNGKCLNTFMGVCMF